MISKLVGEAVGLCVVWLCKGSAKPGCSCGAGVCGAAAGPGRGGCTAGSSSGRPAHLFPWQEEEPEAAAPPLGPPCHSCVSVHKP